MPASDCIPEISNRMRYSDERLRKSRKLFDISRTKVELLKRKKTKRVKVYEKPSKSSWITSGLIGSRDAVLVFRTSILNTRSDEYDGKNADPGVSTSNTSLDNCSSNSSSSLNVEAKPPMEPNLIHNSSSKAKVLSSLPTNVNLEETINDCRGSEPKQPLEDIEKEPIMSPKKRLHNSLSSSENSISSECDDSPEEEKGMHTSCMILGGVRSSHYTHINESSDGSGLQKSDPFDNKENEEDQPESDDLPAVKLKMTYKFMNTETRLLRKIFRRHGLTESNNEHTFNILWTGVHMKPDILRNLTPYQRVNHFPRSYELTRKDRLYKNIEKMQHLKGFKHFDIVPQSFVLPAEYRDLVSAHNKSRGPWIVKPAASSRGRGIFIVTSPDQICADEQGLVSKYVADPLCIDGHKCDLRVYVLVTSFDPLLIYIYKEGLVRLATVKYNRNAENLWNPCMHLCNYSINKYHSDYIKSRDAQDEDVGHKWTLSALLRHLKSQGCDTQQLMANIEDLIVKSIFATAQSIISACRMFVPSGNNCFELYGFDILVDDTLKPWLLEINLSPSMGVDSPIDTKVKASLMTDLLTLVGIPAYTQLMREHYDSTWSRFRNVSYSRRTNSADHVGGGGVSKKTISLKAQLTIEEQRIIRNVRLQNARRGGFVRVFPTEDSMQRYSSFLDPTTGIPLSTNFQNQCSYPMIVPHNFNQMLFNHLYGNESKGHGYNEENSYNERMKQYECVLEMPAPISFRRKKTEPKCIEEGTRLRKQIRKLIESGSELTVLQARQTFGLYLESILKRLAQEPRDYHEKLILKFISRVNGGIKAPVFFKNPFSYRVMNKDRSAMVAKLVGDYLETYNRDTEAYIDSFDNFGKIPIALFNEFITQAQEADLESVLTLHTNYTHTMPFLYNRCGPSVPSTPPIPTGAHGFLKALPSMVIGGNIGTKEMNRIDSYYRNQPIAPTPTVPLVPEIPREAHGFLKSFSLENYNRNQSTALTPRGVNGFLKTLPSMGGGGDVSSKEMNPINSHNRNQSTASTPTGRLASQTPKRARDLLKVLPSMGEKGSIGSKEMNQIDSYNRSQSTAPTPTGPLAPQTPTRAHDFIKALPSMGAEENIGSKEINRIDNYKGNQSTAPTPTGPLSPQTPTLAHDFLKALPSMGAEGNIGSKEMNRIDNYNRNQSTAPTPTSPLSPQTPTRAHDFLKALMSVGAEGNIGSKEMNRIDSYDRNQSTAPTPTSPLAPQTPTRAHDFLNSLLSMGADGNFSTKEMNRIESYNINQSTAPIPTDPLTSQIPTGAHGFSKALPSMVPGGKIVSKKKNRIDSYTRSQSTAPTPTGPLVPEISTGAPKGKKIESVKKTSNKPKKLSVKKSPPRKK